VLPAVLVILAAIADARGSHSLAFNALLGAVPFAAVAAIGAFGDHLDRRTDPVTALQALLWAAVVALLVLSCALRSGALDEIPPLAVSSLVACLGIFTIKVALAAAPYARRLAALRVAKP
jgi:uncharacterized membrane protein YoaK (UPF0700 family)